MTDFELFQLAHYKQRISEVSDPAAKAFLRKSYYQLKNRTNETTSIFCGFTYSGALPVSHYARNSIRGTRTFQSLNKSI